MKGIHEQNFVENFLSNRLVLHNALFEFQELGFSQDFAHFSNCRVLCAVSCQFFLSAKIFVSQSFMQISLWSGPFSNSLKHNFDYGQQTVLWQKRTGRNCDEREKSEGFMAISDGG